MAAEPSEFFLLARIGPVNRLIELWFVREIVPAMRLTVPAGLARACRGVANVRGGVIPVFDLAQRGGELEVSQLIVIVTHGVHGDIGVLVDDVLDMVELQSARVVAHPVGEGRRVRSTTLNGDTLTVFSLNEVIDAA